MTRARYFTVGAFVIILVGVTLAQQKPLDKYALEAAQFKKIGQNPKTFKAAGKRIIWNENDIAALRNEVEQLKAKIAILERHQKLTGITSKGRSLDLQRRQVEALEDSATSNRAAATAAEKQAAQQQQAREEAQRRDDFNDINKKFNRDR